MINTEDTFLLSVTVDKWCKIINNNKHSIEQFDNKESMIH